LHIAQRFEQLLGVYRRPDGSRWTGQRLGDAKGGVVSSSGVTTLRKGRLESPRYEKTSAFAEAGDFAARSR
jgi:hypothetical protein